MRYSKTLSAVLSLAAVAAVTLAPAGDTAPVKAKATSLAPALIDLNTAAAGLGSDAEVTLDLNASVSADLSLALPLGFGTFPNVVGNDASNVSNPFIQPTDPALAGGGRDQTLQFHDLVLGWINQSTVLIGGLGEDILAGGYASDVMIGGPEHFNPRNRDKAFGGLGDDIFLWSPGDGSDRFDGGPGEDTLVFGLLGEDDGAGNPIFAVSNNQQTAQVWLDPVGLPRMDVTNSPGFCRIIDSSTSANAAQELAQIGATRVAQFIIRSVNQNFVNGNQTTDNGLRVSLHLTGVEYVVCASQAGGVIEAFDLRTQPATPIAFSALPIGIQLIVQ
jgi:Ca2+-binding RTX toxin-like protein